MAKPASEIVRQSVQSAGGVLRRATESPLERALREVQLGGAAGGAVHAARQNQDRFLETIEEAQNTLARHASPYRHELDRISSYSHPARPDVIPVVAGRLEVDNAIQKVAQIGARVRSVRRSMRMTQQQFADFSGVGRRFLVELEKGKPSLEIDKVLAVCRAAGIRILLG